MSQTDNSNLDSVIKNLQNGASGILDFATKLQDSMTDEQKKEVAGALSQLGTVNSKLEKAIKDLHNATSSL